MAKKNSIDKFTPYFTGNNVREVFYNVLSGSDVPPKDKIIDFIAGRLNSHRHMAHARRTWLRQRTVSQIEFVRWLDEADKHLNAYFPKKIDDADFPNMPASVPDTPFYVDDAALTLLRKAIANVKATSNLTVPPPDFKAPHEQWQILAPRLAAEFRWAMKTVYPDRIIGNSNSGPVGRYVSAVLVHITGDIIKAGTVSAFLKQQICQEGTSSYALLPG